MHPWRIAPVFPFFLSIEAQRDSVRTAAAPQTINTAIILLVVRSVRKNCTVTFNMLWCFISWVIWKISPWMDLFIVIVLRGSSPDWAEVGKTKSLVCLVKAQGQKKKWFECSQDTLWTVEQAKEVKDGLHALLFLNKFWSICRQRYRHVQVKQCGASESSFVVHLCIKAKVWQTHQILNHPHPMKSKILHSSADVRPDAPHAQLHEPQQGHKRPGATNTCTKNTHKETAKLKKKNV